MKTFYKTMSWAALGLTIVPSFLVLSGVLQPDTHKWLMLAGFVLWFASAPVWIGREK